ncbi:cytochrome P450 [Clavulina sp. PMI_390]|nr:cytochrome P450 [Clavulina sp. PMI_390]
MLTQSWPSILACSACVLAAVFILYVRNPAGKKHLPPGPSGIPWVGQVFKIPMLHSHLYYTELARKYGDIYTVTALGQKLVVLNSYATAFELLGKRGSIHCNRPNYPFMRRFLGLEHVLALGDPDHSWKEERRLYQTLLNKEVSRVNYAKDIATQAQTYILHVIESGRDIDNELLDKAVHKIFLQSTYGMATEDDDPFLLHAIHSTNIASFGMLPAKHLVNSFPILQHLPPWVPFQTWRIEAERSRPALDHMRNAAWKHTTEAIANGTAEESFAYGLTREQNSTNEHHLKFTALTNLIAGAETTNGVCRVFILAMLLHPDIQRKAQKELDQVFGHELPSLNNINQKDLPYFDAVLKEVFRWRPVAPLSIPTVPTKDDIYEGYMIPHDSIVVQNTWALSRDERMYIDAESFDPDRWLVANPPIDPRLWTFGIGRRVCPGMPYAELVYTILFMTLLATVDIVPAHDEDGQRIFVDSSAPTTGRVACIPTEFSYSLRPRSDAAVALLREATER